MWWFYWHWVSWYFSSSYSTRDGIESEARTNIPGNIDGFAFVISHPILQPMTTPAAAKPVTRLFPFVLKSRILIVGRDTLHRSKGKLHFVLLSTDISERSRAEILSDFSHYPIVQLYTSAELEGFFGVKGAKVIGFAKSGLAQSIYKELKDHRLNCPPSPTPKPAGSPPTPPSAQKAS
jgi:hypothetical protein